MKRSTDDVGKSRELKRTDHVTQNSGQPQMIGEGRKLTASEAKQYIDEVNSKLTRENFSKFTDILKDYKAYRIDIPGVKEKLMQMFQEDKELLLGFNVFLPKESRIIFKQEDIVMHHWSSSFITKTTSLQGTFASDGESAGPEKTAAKWGPIRTKKRSAIGGDVILASKESLVSSKHNKKTKAFQDLNRSNDENCNPSYRLAPKDYPISEASQRTAMDKEVLNDDWVCVRYKSEDHPFKTPLKNQHEEILFQSEDDRFEIDMVLERIKLAVEETEKLMRGIYDESIRTDGLFCLEDHFSGPSLRCIETLYVDHGLDLVDELRNNVSRGLPVILNRLKQKEGNLMKFSSDFNKHCRQIFVKNHQGSLDHRGFHLKQHDS